jgi:predicted GIY-YIG superfamily endonuclease
MKTGLIYKITHKKSGKSYIGLTTRSFKERMNEYKYHYGNPKYFQNSAIYQALRSDG